MLVVARKAGQSILLGEDIEIAVISVRGDQVRLAIRAPRSVTIQRRDALEQVEKENVAALAGVDELFTLIRQPG